MKLNEFANNFLGSSRQAGNIWDSPKFDRLSNVLGGVENANPMLVTATWQTLLESPDLSKKLYPKAVQMFSGYPNLKKNLEKYLLCLGNNKYCLLVFDPTFTSEEPMYVDASKNNTKKSINAGISNWHSKMTTSIINRKNPGANGIVKSMFSDIEEQNSSSFFNEGSNDEEILNAFEPEIIHWGITNSEWPMIISKPIDRVYTSLYPEKPHKVILTEGEAFRSLAGIYTINTQGIFGVTICLHSLPNSHAEEGITKVIINGLTGTVISVHNISDSCFVQLNATEEQITDLLKINGPLLSTTPREFEKCYFMNKEGNKIETNVIGWSPDILYFDLYNQVKVLTNPITNPGDSGSALIDSSGNVLGFSFYRTEINAVKEFSAWIWAASVFKAHNLNF